MNIGKYIRFFRHSKQFHWHIGQPLHLHPDQHNNGKIIEYQDRWTLSPSRPRFWFNNSRGL